MSKGIWLLAPDEPVPPTFPLWLRRTELVAGESIACGAGEQAYLCKDDAPEITYVNRDTIDRSDEAYTDCPE